MEKPNYPRKESPAVLSSYPSLTRGRQELKVRALQYSKSGPLLDIREFLKTNTESRFTKKGITLDIPQVESLVESALKFLAEHKKLEPK